jgi:excisionase family DNA binding protein
MFLTTSEVAKRYKVDTETVRRWIRSGRLPAINLAPGGVRARFRVRESDLENFEKLLAVPGPRPVQRRRTVDVSKLTPLPGGLQYF